MLMDIHQIILKIKLVVFSAPSGCGKTTIAKAVVARLPVLSFCVSATTRLRRGEEKEGVDYYYLSVEQFKQKIANDEFVEWEEVYPGKFYGTLKSEIERINSLGLVPVLDVDVKGAQSVKKIHGENALLIFIKVPTTDIIKERLLNRDTESAEQIKIRLDRIPEELTYEKKSDVTVMNIDLQKAIDKTVDLVTYFLETSF